MCQWVRNDFSFKCTSSLPYTSPRKSETFSPVNLISMGLTFFPMDLMFSGRRPGGPGFTFSWRYWSSPLGMHPVELVLDLVPGRGGPVSQGPALLLPHQLKQVRALPLDGSPTGGHLEDLLLGRARLPRDKVRISKSAEYCTVAPNLKWAGKGSREFIGPNCRPRWAGQP